MYLVVEKTYIYLILFHIMQAKIPYTVSYNRKMLGSLKKRSSDFKRGGANGLKGGGVQYICLTMTTNLAYAKYII